jgi:hypothetical protein
MSDAENRPTPNPQSPPQGYQPSLGRKILMFVLTLCALIGLWVYYWFAAK